jgi:hypothetical protein
MTVIILDSRKLVDLHSDGVPNLLQESCHIVWVGVLVTSSLRLPGLNDGERAPSKFFEEPDGDAAWTFLRKSLL